MTSVHIDTARAWRGGQNQVLQLVTGLAERGDTAVLVAHEDGDLKRRASEGMRFVGFTPRSDFDVHAAWQLARVFKAVQPDVVHAHDEMAVALGAMALKMKTELARPPLVVAARRRAFHLERQAFAKWKYGHVNVFIAASAHIAGRLESDGIAADRIAVVHDGVNTGVIDKIARVDAHGTFWLPKGAPLVGNIGALVPWKGQRHLVAAAARVVREVPDARFLILGDGELREALEKQVKDLGLERHVVLGGFRDGTVSLLKSMDVFVTASTDEGLGSALLDALACRRASVGARAGGIQEALVDGETGLLVPPRDDAAMAAAIVRLLKDATLRRTLGDAGRARVEQEFSVGKMVAGTADVYQRSPSA